MSDIEKTGHVPAVTIVVAACNVEKYIRECLESLVAQTITDIEIICVDDCSSDATGRIINELAENDDRIRVFHNERNLGVSESRNLGIDEARADYICFVDGDDKAAPDMAELLLKEATSGGADLVIGDYYVADGDTVRYESFYGRRDISRERMERDAILGVNGLSTSVGVPWGRIYKRSFLLEKGIRFVPGLKRMQDMIFNNYVFELAGKISFVNRPIYYYRIHRSSAVRAMDMGFADTAAIIMDELRSFAAKYNKEWEEVLITKEMNLLLEAMTLYPLRKAKSLTYSQKIAYIRSASDKLLSELYAHRGNVGGSPLFKLKYFLMKRRMFGSLYLLCKIRYIF